MTFRRLISACSLSALLTVAFSCTRGEVAGGYVETTFSVVAPVTKSYSAVRESEVGTLDILVFRTASGALESHGRTEGDNLSLGVAKGLDYRWYAVANAPEGLSSVGSLQQFLSLRSRLEDNTPGSLVMSGSGQGVLDGNAVTVRLSRLVSRVELDKVSPVYFQTAYTDADVTLANIFLYHAAGESALGGQTVEPSLWYDGNEDNGLLLDGFLREERGESISGEKTDENLRFYCCPNPADGTRLVLEVSVDGRSEYYPVNIGPMAGNTSYRIADVRLLGPGAPTPGGEVDRASLTFTVTVNAWGESSTDVEL